MGFNLFKFAQFMKADYGTTKVFFGFVDLACKLSYSIWHKLHNFETDMTAQKYFLPYLNGRPLDQFLERGWFRMNQSIFTTHFLKMEETFHPAVWLRYALNPTTFARIQKKIKKLMPPNVTFRIEPWHYTEDQEALYFEHALHTGLPLYTGLYRMMYGKGGLNIFDTWQVAIYAKKRLVAFGLFDRGLQASAGIISVYDPAYSKYSTGKLLMYLKMRYCALMGQTYYYPGYAVPGCHRFNYKLGILPGHIEYYEPAQKQWLAAPEEAEALPNYLEAMKRALQALMADNRMQSLGAKLMYYSFFDGALQDIYVSPELEYPLFIHLPLGHTSATDMAITYNPGNGLYQVLRTEKLDPAMLKESDYGLVYDQVLSIVQQVAMDSAAEHVLAEVGHLLLQLDVCPAAKEDFSIFLNENNG